MIRLDSGQSSLILQYSFNSVVNMGMEELEKIAQNLDESFSDYLNRWWNKLILVHNKPSEQELIRVFISRTLPLFRDELCFLPLREFVDVYREGVKIEDRLSKEKKAKV